MSSLFPIPVPRAAAEIPVMPEAPTVPEKKKPTDPYVLLLDLIREFGPMTDEAISDIGVEAGIREKTEQVRRMVRTLRRRGDVVPESMWLKDIHSLEGRRVEVQLEELNSSGKWAGLWRAKDE